MVAEANGASITNKYCRGANGIIYAEFNGTETKYLKDGHGNVRGLANMSGTTLNKSYYYDAWGVELNIDSNDANPFRYCGEYYDREIDKVYLRARYYTPIQGRFMTEDPIKDGVNWYAYCGNEPVNRVDPTGEAWGVTARDAYDITAKYGMKNFQKVMNAGNRARKNATDKASQWGFDDNGKLITWDNRADAMRHFQWNAVMTREIGWDIAQYAADRHEINGAKDVDLFQQENNGIVRMKVGQATLMDLWNNSVGRTLAKDEDLRSMNYDELFYYAEMNNLLILDANNAFEFYGVTDYVDWNTWTVEIEYNINSETITFMKEGLNDMKLSVGIDKWW